MVKAEFAVYGVVADRVVAGHGARRDQRGDVPALDIVYAPEPLPVDMSDRSVEQIALHHRAVGAVEFRCHEVMAARQPDDQVRFVQGLMGGSAAAATTFVALGTDRVVRVAPRISGKDLGGALQTAPVSGQAPAQPQQHRHAAEQQVGSKPPGVVETAAGQYLSVHGAAMYARPIRVEVQLGGVVWAEVVVVVPRRFVSGVQVQGQECVRFRGQAAPSRDKRRQPSAPACSLQRGRVEQQGLSTSETE